MSANITIKEGGAGKALNAIKKLKISTGNGTSLWLPENDLALDDKSVTKNGTYKASDDGLYGYSEVTVNVAKKSSTSGKKPDGNDYNVERDTDGNIVETKLPSSIRLTTNPTKMTYNSGESIDMTGAVVKAYCGDGTLWEGDGYSGGIVPLSEIEINPATASSSSGGVIYTGGGINAKTFSLKGVEPYNTKYRATYIQQGSNGEETSENYVWVFLQSDTNNFPSEIYMTKYAENNGTIKSFIAWEGSFSCSAHCSVKYGSAASARQYISDGEFNSCSTSTQNTHYAWQYLHQLLPESTTDPQDKNINTLTPTDGQAITILWERPKDDEELTTSFNISVS